MCGIVGYVGKKNAVRVLVDGLEKLEYRGYDSAGVCFIQDGKQVVIKAKGKIENLKNKLGEQSITSSIGIGHTRWATHGEPNETNAHPHQSQNKFVTLVHNGIIENYSELKAELVKKNYHFYSETDTEVVANLIEKNLFSVNFFDFLQKNAKTPQNECKMIDFLLKTLKNTFNELKGSYALAIIFSFLPDKIFVARNESPLIVGLGQNENFVASDVPALLKFTRQVTYLNNHEIGVVDSKGVKIFDKDLTEKSINVLTIDWNLSEAEKNGFAHYMLKEIYEEPKTVADTLSALCYEKENKICFNFNQTIFDDVENIVFIGCGSAFHVGLGLTYVFEKLTGIPARAILASEFRYNSNIFGKNTLIVSISQSGETADTLSGINLAKNLGLKTLSIVNVKGSSIARESDQVLYTQAGMEIAVATTKAYSCQLATGYVMALALAQKRKTLSNQKIYEYYKNLQNIPKIIENILKNAEKYKNFAEKIYQKSFLYMIGRGIDYAICRESALKMKEVSYISTEAFPAGELKHGTISLIEPDTFVFGFLTQDNTYDKTISNLLETKCRGAVVVGVGYDFGEKVKDLDYFFEIPNCEHIFSNIVAVVPMQLLSYYVSILRGNDVDKPRNLAKSVTVE